MVAQEIIFEEIGSELRRVLESAGASVQVYSPYITPSALGTLLENLDPSVVSVSVVTTWSVRDFVQGASSLDLYPFCRERGWPLFVSKRLHLKTLVIDYRLVVTGSANFTNRGLGIVPASNYETMVTVGNPGVKYLRWLESIKNESTLVDDDIHGKLSCIVKEAPPFEYDVSDKQSEFDAILVRERKFLIDDLPETPTPADLYRALHNAEARDPETMARALRDAVKFDCYEGDSTRVEDIFYERLSESFFSHPLISELCDFIDKPRRFGEIKEWLQHKCCDYPTPRRRELTRPTQILYKWMEVLGKNRFAIERPHFTEIIRPIDSTSYGSE